MLLESLQIDIAQFTTTKVHVIKSFAGKESTEIDLSWPLKIL